MTVGAAVPQHPEGVNGTHLARVQGWASVKMYEFSCSIKCRDFLDQLGHYHLLKEDSAPWG
jgi:hypothetical protein